MTETLLASESRSLLPDSVMWHGDLRADGVLLVSIDRRDKSANALSKGMLEELSSLIETIRQTPTIRGVLFRSGKKGSFIVGADVTEMKQLTDATEATELSRLGQRVFGQLESLSVPTVALISGACLGGGLEFAMSCRFRIADDHAKTVLGLPEVKLGLIPGWGGTVRLPKLVGLLEALPMILTGRILSSRQARSKGLIHDVVPIEALPFVGEQLLRVVLKFGSASALLRSPKRSWTARLVEAIPPLRNLVFRRAEGNVRQQTQGHYPAPLTAIRVLKTGFGQPNEHGFNAESLAIGELTANPVTRECLRVFFLQEDAKKPPRLGEPTPDDDAKSSKPDICQAAVLGAGAMGAGIALLMAQKGIWTRLKDLKPEFLAKGLTTIRKLVSSDVKRRKITPLQASDTLDRLRPTTDLTGLSLTDIVIEAVAESLPIKQQVFRELAEATSAHTVLATNTSSLLVRDIGQNVPHPERVIGLHFFNPPHQMPLVEIVRTDQSSPKAIATAFEQTQRLGKTVVIVKDCSGFLVNRLLAPYMNEAGWLLLEVSDAMSIDRAAVAFGLPMGPLELTDLVGLEVAQHVAANMHSAYGERMTPAPLWNALRELSATATPAKSLLTGKGNRKRLNSLVQRAINNVRNSGTFSIPGGSLTREDITQRLIYPIINEAARCLDEGIVSSADEIDLAMIFGTGFAPFRGGPMRYAQSVGWSHVMQTLERFAAQRPRLAPSDALRKLAATHSGSPQ